MPQPIDTPSFNFPDIETPYFPSSTIVRHSSGAQLPGTTLAQAPVTRSQTKAVLDVVVCRTE